MKSMLLLGALFCSAPLFAAPANSQTSPPTGGASAQEAAELARLKAELSKNSAQGAKSSAKTLRQRFGPANPRSSAPKSSGSAPVVKGSAPAMTTGTKAAPVKKRLGAVPLIKTGPSNSFVPTHTTSTAGQTELQKLPNGIQFIARPDKLAPLAAISVVIRVGAAEETPQNAGWRRFLVGAMLRGAPQGFENAPADAPVLPNEALPRAAEKLGGSIGATVGDDFIEIYVVGPSAQAPELLDLALALWQNPRLSEADLRAARESSQGQIDADTLDTASKTQAALRSQLFRDARGELSAYGLPDYGTAESLASLTDEKLRELFTSRVTGARATVAATGDFDASALRLRLQKLPARMSREPATPSFAAPKSVAALVVRELPIPSAWVFISYPLAGDTKNDAPALRVLASALGDSGAARLPERLLKNQPMGAPPVATSVAAQFIPRRYAGELVVFAQTGPQNVERVKNALLDEINKLREAPLPQSELQSAKVYARGSWSLERQSGRERAFQTALSPALGGPLDAALPARLQSVTSAQVQQVARKYLKSYAVALVMPGE